MRHLRKKEMTMTDHISKGSQANVNKEISEGADNGSKIHVNSEIAQINKGGVYMSMK